MIIECFLIMKTLGRLIFTYNNPYISAFNSIVAGFNKLHGENL
jgi:hypothetical protein